MEVGGSSTQQAPLAAKQTRKRSQKDYTIGWICAIRTEYVAAIAFLDEEHERPEHLPQTDENDYTLGRYGQHNTVIAVLPYGEYGTTSAAVVAQQMLNSFPNVRVGLMVGIGGGAPSNDNDIRLGDVVVSIPRNGDGGVYEYNFGKAVQDMEFQVTSRLAQPPRVLRTAAHGLQTQYDIYGHQLDADIEIVLENRPNLRRNYSRPSEDTDRLYQSNVLHGNGLCCEAVGSPDPSILVRRLPRTEQSLIVHYGLVASANCLMKDALVRDKLSRDKSVLCFEMEAAGLMNHFPCLVVRGICDYSDTHKNKQWQGYAAMTATAYAKDLLTRMPIRGIDSEQTIVDHLRQFGQDLNVINRKIVDIDDKVISIHENTTNIDEKMILNLLPIVDGVMFDSHSEEHNRFCLPNTRVDLLHTISEWADDQEREAVFWLNGMAGTGKSTIARTLSRSFSETRQLGASFFFKRGESDRSVAAKFFTTIAAQLLRTQPAIAPYIKSVLNNDPSIVQKSLSQQFDKLILKPLSSLPDDFQKRKPLLVVVDALDECDGEDDIRILVKLFSLAKKQVTRLRIFVTSRPELPPRMGFDDLSGRYEKFILHEIHRSIIKKDMHTFLRHELTVRKSNYNKSVKDDSRCLPSDWPTESDIGNLLDMTVPLFISAATVCRFIFDRYISGSPGTKLCAILTQQTASHGAPARGGLLASHPHESRMNAVYQPILTQMLRSLSVNERKTALTEFQKIVGSIVVLASPLSASSLACLLDIAQVIIESRLDHLHSVLNIPDSSDEPIKLFHLSFRDFLLDTEKRETESFWVNEKSTHRLLQQNCLRVMKDSLKKDLCNLDWPGSVRPSSERVDQYLRPEVQYACQYWVHHVQQAGDYSWDDNEVYDFLIIHLLHWLEAMALIGRIDEALTNVRSLRSRLQKKDFPELSAFLDDAIRFMLTNMHIMRTAPLQIYSSALIFAPTESIVRRVYRNDIPKYISTPPQTQSRWSAWLHTLEGHQSPLQNVAFSPDGTLIASASEGIIQIYSSSTGSVKQVMQQSAVEFRSTAFSPDGNRLVSISDDGVIQLWSVDTGSSYQKKNMITISRNNPCSIMFSSNGKYMALCRNYQTQLWSMDTGKLRSCMNLDDKEAKFIGFSANSELLVTVSYRGLINSWSVDTGSREKVVQLPVYREHEDVLNISPGAELVVTQLVKLDNRPQHNDLEVIRVWSASTGKLLQVIQHCRSRCEFSPDSKLLATSGYNYPCHVHIWSVKTGALQQSLECVSHWCSWAFSPDATLLASGHKDGKVRLWEILQTKEGDKNQYSGQKSMIESPTKVNFKPAKRLTFSPNKKFVVSTREYDDTVLLSHTLKGSLDLKLGRNSYMIVNKDTCISPDSQLIALAVAKQWYYTIDICSATTGMLLQSVEGVCVAFSSDSRVIAIASAPHKIQLWSTTDLLEGEGKDQGTLKFIREFQNKSCSNIASITFSFDSRLVVSTSYDGSLLIWSIFGRLQKKFYTRDIAAVAFSPDSTLMSIRHWPSNELLLMSTMDFSPQRQFKCPLQSNTLVAFSPDSRLVATTSSGYIRLWSASTGTCLQVLRIYLTRPSINQLSFDKTSRFLLSNIGTIRLPREQWVNTAIDSTSTTSVASSHEIQGENDWQDDYEKLNVSCGFSLGRCWVTWNGERLLWLPVDFRPETFAVSGSYVAICTQFGEIVTMGFSGSLLDMMLEGTPKKMRKNRNENGIP